MTVAPLAHLQLRRDELANALVDLQEARTKAQAQVDTLDAQVADTTARIAEYDAAIADLQTP